MDTKSLQVYLDSEITNFKRSNWIGSLILKNITIIYEDDDKVAGTTGTIDVCQYLPGGSDKKNAVELRFDSSTFPPSESLKAAFEKSNPTYKKLHEELQRGAVQCGYTLVPKSGARFVCKCSRTYENAINYKKQDDDKENELQQPFRQLSWKYDSKNSRKKGPEPLRRNTATSLPMDPDKLCKFAIKLSHDSNGYYIRAKYGCATHSHHPFIKPGNNCYSLKLLTDGEQEELRRLSKAKLGAAHGRNYIFANKPDMYLSKSQIRYAFRHADASSLGVAIPDLKMGSDGLIDFFNNRNDINYCIWGGNNIDERLQSNLLFNVSYQDGKEEIEDLDALCHDVVDYYMKEKQILLEPENHKSMFIACAWTSKEERRLFQLFPFVFKVDATCHTNNEKRHLLTFTSKTVSAKSFVFLKVYLPDQKAATFRWVFQVALPKLLGKKTAERVQYVMTDGDSHEYTELDKAIEKYFVNAFRGRCGWHIINKGWKRNGISEKVVPPDQQFVLKQALNTILNWLYMLCSPGGCEDEEEYELAKSLLLAYIHHHVGKALQVGSDKQGTQVERILTFLTNHVFVHEEHFVFYPRKFILHFDEATNSSHEGTNNGLKSHSAAVLPSMDITTSAQVIQFQTDISMKEMDRYCCKNAVQVNLHAVLPTANKVSPLLMSILERQWGLRNNYYCRRNDHRCEWSVVVKNSDNKKFHTFDYEVNKNNELIPRFKRVRIVRMNIDRELECSCGLFSRFGYGCVHILSVILLEEPCYNGYRQNDVRVFWWNDYCFYARREDEYERGTDWNKNFMQLLDNDIGGPRMPENWVCGDFAEKSNVSESTEEVLDLESIFEIKPAVDRLRNYTSEQANRALRTFADGSVGYSQHLCNVDDDDDSVFETDNRGFDSTDDGFDFDSTEGTTVGGKRRQRVGFRSTVKPLYDQMCSLYESKHAQHADMPSFDGIVKAMEENIHDINRFFNGLQRNKGRGEERYVSVCTQKESSRNRCFVSSNGLR